MWIKDIKGNWLMTSMEALEVNDFSSSSLSQGKSIISSQKIEPSVPKAYSIYMLYKKSLVEAI